VRLNPLDYGTTSEAHFRLKNFVIPKFYTSYPLISSFLKQQLSAYETVYSRFRFLRELSSLFPLEIQTKARELVDIYRDLNYCLEMKLVQFVEFSKEYEKERDKETIYEEHLYRFLMEKNVKDAFPNVEIVLRMYLVLMVNNVLDSVSFRNLNL